MKQNLQYQKVYNKEQKVKSYTRVPFGKAETISEETEMELVLSSKSICQRSLLLEVLLIFSTNVPTLLVPTTITLLPKIWIAGETTAAFLIETRFDVRPPFVALLVSLFELDIVDGAEQKEVDGNLPFNFVGTKRE